MSKYLMAVGAHADDIEGNAGGTLLKYRKLGYEIIYVMATNNMSGSWSTLGSDGKVVSRHVPWSQIMPQRKLEAKDGADYYGAKLFHLNHPQRHYRGEDGKEYSLEYGAPCPACIPENTPSILTAHETPAARKALAKIIDEFKPEVIMTHGPIQIDIEHIGTSMLVTKTIQECSYPGMVLLWPSVDQTSFVETYICRQTYIDISDYNDEKFATIRIHKCQMPSTAHIKFPPWEEGTGCKHVEAYAILQEGNTTGAFQDEIIKNKKFLASLQG